MTVQPTVRGLERLSYRMPLAVDCHDRVTGVRVTDGLVATAWVAGATDWVHALRSPVSGLLGFRRLPSAGTTYHVLVQDTRQRFVPATVTAQVPVAAPVRVELSSAVTRPSVSGLAAVTGTVRNAGGAELAWALVTISTATTTSTTAADGRGRFVFQMPYPEALPPPTGTGAGLSAVSWPVTVSVRCEPAALVTLPGGVVPAPPDQASIDAQGTAQVLDNGPQPSTTATLRFGAPLHLALTVVPA